MGDGSDCTTHSMFGPNCPHGICGDQHACLCGYIDKEAKRTRTNAYPKVKGACHNLKNAWRKHASVTTSACDGHHLI